MFNYLFVENDGCTKYFEARRTKFRQVLPIMLVPELPLLNETGRLVRSLERRPAKAVPMWMELCARG